MKILTVVFCSLLFSASLAFAASGPVIDQGKLPALSFTDMPQKAAAIWEYVKGATGIDAATPPPSVFIYPFVASEGSPEFRAFRDGWIQSHPEIWDDWQRANPGKQRQPDTFPFPPQFVGFYYTGSGSIELNPSVFTAFMQNDPNGVPRDIAGLGYYSMGHEMHHYALEVRGVPIRLHHCVFLLARKSSPTSLMESLVDTLIASGTSSFVAKIRAYRGEVSMDPCSALSAEDRQAAQDWSQKL